MILTAINRYSCTWVYRHAKNKSIGKYFPNIKVFRFTESCKEFSLPNLDSKNIIFTKKPMRLIVFNAFLGEKTPKSKLTIKLNSETMLRKKFLSLKYYRFLLICKFEDTPLVFCKHIFFSTTGEMFFGSVYEYGAFIRFSWVSLNAGHIEILILSNWVYTVPQSTLWDLGGTYFFLPADFFLIITYVIIKLVYFSSALADIESSHFLHWFKFK